MYKFPTIYMDIEMKFMSVMMEFFSPSFKDG